MAPKQKAATRATRNDARYDARATRGALFRGEALLNTPTENPQPRKKRKVESPAPAPTTASSAAAGGSSSAAGGSSSAAGASSSSSAAVKTVIIEHCLEGDLYKKKADQFRKALERSAAAVNVVINPEAPRKGCFEIREEGGDAFVSLVDIVKAFDELKVVDVKKVVADIVKRI